MQPVEVAVIGTGWCGGIRAETLSRSALVDKLHICEIRPDRLAEVKALTLGFSHLALDVPDVDTAYHALLAAGASDRMSPRASPEPGVRMAFVADPEGNLIELLDRTAL